jgi:hypothetical protein
VVCLFYFFIFLKDIEPVLSELETSENQKKLMNCNDLSEGSTEGKLQHCHFNQSYFFKVMFKLCLYDDILLISGGFNTKWSIVPMWRLGIRSRLKWTLVLKYYYMLVLCMRMQSLL